MVADDDSSRMQLRQRRRVQWPHVLAPVKDSGQARPLRVEHKTAPDAAQDAQGVRMPILS